MRCLLVALIFISLWALFSELRAESSTACPVTTQVESTAIARAWHDDVINRRNPTKLSDIVGPEVVHHAAGGYPKIMNAEGIAAMMGDFLAAFPDLLITSISSSRRTTSLWSVTRQAERIRDRSATCNPPIAQPLGLVSIYFALVADALSKFGQRLMPKAARGS